MTDKTDKTNNSSSDNALNKDKTSENQTSKKGASRRTAVRTIVLGSGVITTAKALDAKWLKPIVDGVITPAHAQMSPDPVSGP